ncbi:MAG: hypothetical protein KAR19_12570 [Bacteroidales bacterium]|nr:hypothetical protein [Bacteroidales bacterium]
MNKSRGFYLAQELWHFVVMNLPPYEAFKQKYASYLQELKTKGEKETYHNAYIALCDNRTRYVGFDLDYLQTISEIRSYILREVTNMRERTPPPEVTNFNFDLDNEMYAELYDILAKKLEIVDLEKTDISTFRNVLSHDWNSHEEKIYLCSKTNEFALAASIIEKQFERFTPKNIETSKKFISKRGIPITSNNISSSNSQTRKVGGLPNKEKITSLITNLFAKH